MRLAAAAWLAYGRGARRTRRCGSPAPRAELEEKTGKHPVTPGVPLPGARAARATCSSRWDGPAEALAEYEASLREAPNRFNSLDGAARAAELAEEAGSRARSLRRGSSPSASPGSTRPELAEARRLLAAGG